MTEDNSSSQEDVPYVEGVYESLPFIENTIPVVVNAERVSASKESGGMITGKEARYTIRPAEPSFEDVYQSCKEEGERLVSTLEEHVSEDTAVFGHGIGNENQYRIRFQGDVLGYIDFDSTSSRGDVEDGETVTTLNGEKTLGRAKRRSKRYVPQVEVESYLHTAPSQDVVQLLEQSVHSAVICLGLRLDEEWAADQAETRLEEDPDLADTLFSYADTDAETLLADILPEPYQEKRRTQFQDKENGDTS